VTRWYAVATQPRMELWARANLWERGLEVYLPQYMRRVRHARRVIEVKSAFFPGYLFVAADLELGHRRKVDSAPGTIGMVAFGEQPAAVPDAVMAELRRREGADGLHRIAAPGFRPGQKVRLAEGAFADHAALFESEVDATRVVVLLELLGRRVRMKVARDVVVAGA